MKEKKKMQYFLANKIYTKAPIHVLPQYLINNNICHHGYPAKIHLQEQNQKQTDHFQSRQRDRETCVCLITCSC